MDDEERRARRRERKKRRREEREEEDAMLDEEDLDLIGETHPDYQRRQEAQQVPQPQQHQSRQPIRLTQILAKTIQATQAWPPRREGPRRDQGHRRHLFRRR